MRKFCKGLIIDRILLKVLYWAHGSLNHSHILIVGIYHLPHMPNFQFLDSLPSEQFQKTNLPPCVVRAEEALQLQCRLLLLLIFSRALTANTPTSCAALGVGFLIRCFDYSILASSFNTPWLTSVSKVKLASILMLKLTEMLLKILLFSGRAPRATIPIVVHLSALVSHSLSILLFFIRVDLFIVLLIISCKYCCWSNWWEKLQSIFPVLILSYNCIIRPINFLFF